MSIPISMWNIWLRSSDSFAVSIYPDEQRDVRIIARRKENCLSCPTVLIASVLAMDLL